MDANFLIDCLQPRQWRRDLTQYLVYNFEYRNPNIDSVPTKRFTPHFTCRPFCESHYAHVISQNV